jgi:tripartite-type tricarboxylate transporter receptor subunit TctC
LKNSARAARLIAAAAIVLASSAWAQTFPTKSVTIIVPFPPGGTTDVLARTIGQKLSEMWKQPVVIDNRAGAGATIGASVVAKANPDGHTLLMGAVHHTIASSVYASLPYDFQKDLAPVTTVAMVPNVLAINPAIPAKNMKELVAYGKANPGKLTFGSNGQGTLQHLIGEQFSGLNGVEMLHVPYKGSGPLTTDLVAGQVSMSFDTITPVLGNIKAGKIRALAVTTAHRSRHHRSPQPCAARCADTRGGRPGRVRPRHLVRHPRARQYAQGRHRQAQQGHRCRAEFV